MTGSGTPLLPFAGASTATGYSSSRWQMNRRVGEAGRKPVKRRFSLTGMIFLMAIFLMAIVAFLGRRQTGAPPDDNHTTKNEPARVVWPDSKGPGLNLTEEMMDPNSMARQLRDQMTLAKAYVVIAKENSNFQLAWEFSQHIRECQLLLSEAVTHDRRISEEDAGPIIRDMSVLIYQAKELHYDSATTIMKLKAQMQILEERANQASIQSTFLGQLAAEAIPKSLHCFGLRLTMAWAQSTALRSAMKTRAQASRLVDKSLYHFCIFSDNVLATAVVVNSTVQNAKYPEKCVFHIVTDQINFWAMHAWFAMNPPGDAAIEIQDVDEFTWLNASYVPVLKQLQDAEMQSYYFKASMEEPKNTIKFRNPKYMSMLNHLRFYIPEVYPALDKLVFLDDDVVVQKDLSPLFELDLKGNVNGAVETCLESFHRFHKYLNFSHPLIRDSFDPDACGWAFGMNVFDLVAWRENDITRTYHYWQEQNVNRTLWKLGTLPPGLLTFYARTLPVDRSWHVLGLGYDQNVDFKLIENAAVIHYNGNMKPWLKLAMTKYKPLWSQYVNYSQPIIQQCNIK
ncbi:hypothetical protein CBR_g11198 [Chara braunii]|uniref:Hexosyltransferase n=1 Tax=Chara braunii TaxID=69332 RepID=A0A388KQJ2_CHABU|nr:hypothetical protein CBR_g11198 [Chara braunii]|eukprot:GBG72268.1 hypothetical protein CBR_g11198 [Chara braunii]